MRIIVSIKEGKQPEKESDIYASYKAENNFKSPIGKVFLLSHRPRGKERSTKEISLEHTLGLSKIMYGPVKFCRKRMILG